jgi:hypothetical protein
LSDKRDETSYEGVRVGRAGRGRPTATSRGVPAAAWCIAASSSRVNTS